MTTPDHRPRTVRWVARIDSPRAALDGSGYHAPSRDPEVVTRQMPVVDGDPPAGQTVEPAPSGNGAEPTETARTMTSPS